MLCGNSGEHEGTLSLLDFSRSLSPNNQHAVITTPNISSEPHVNFCHGFASTRQTQHLVSRFLFPHWSPYPLCVKRTVRHDGRQLKFSLKISRLRKLYNKILKKNIQTIL